MPKTNINRYSRPLEQNGNFKHGGKCYHPVEYKTWQNIKTRCYNKNNPDYPAWGGRGIIVCREWKDNFSQFYADMGDRPSQEHKIDRIDNDGPYSADNCRWATQVQQSNNSRRNHVITYKGRTMNLGEWADELGISSSLLRARLGRLGWSVERSLQGKISR